MKRYRSVWHSGIHLKAVATVEASLVMPLFIYATVAVMYMLQILMVKQDINTAGYNCVRTLTKYSYVYKALTDSDKEVTFLTAYGIMLSELGADYAKEHGIVGGNAGIVLIGTDLLKEQGGIDVKVTYQVRNPFDIFGIGVVTVSQTFSGQGWLGDKSVSADIGSGDNERLVYITTYGSVYHTSEECAYINLSVSQVSAKEISGRRNQNGSRYYPCEYCLVDANTPGEVYITNYGSRYHGYADCTAIRRTVIRIPISKAAGRRICEKCRNR